MTKKLLSTKTGYNQHGNHYNRMPSKLEQNTTTDIVNVFLYLKSQGLSFDTLKNISKALRFLVKRCNLNNPENVKHFIAKYNGATGYKKNLCYAYNHYVNYHEFTWKKPNYKPIQRLPRIPNEEKINMIISASHFKLAAKLNISEETEFRLPIERLKE